MVATVSNHAKKCTPPSNIRTGAMHPPVLVSPISVAHRNKMLENETGKKAGGGGGAGNWMRDQWVANLKKKRMSGNGSDSATSTPTNATPTGSGSNTPNGTPTKHDGRSEKTSNARQRRESKSAPSIPALHHVPSPPQNGMADKDSLSLMHPSMFFNDLGCFELESPSFMRLTPSQEANMALPVLSSSAPVTSSTLAAKATQSKKWGKPLMKKRGNASAHLDPNAPKPRTPARKLNNGNRFFDDLDVLSVASSPLSSSSASYSFSSVGMPSNFHADSARMWGPELDFTGGYVDTFLDLPTPKSAEMPVVSGPYTSGNHVHLGKKQHVLDRELEQPKLIRTTSIEQEGLSHAFEQTAFLGDAGASSSASSSSSSYGQSPGRTPSRRGSYQPHHQQVHAVAGAVDEYFGKIMPTPHHHHHHHQMMLNAAAAANARLQPTPRAGMARSGSNFDNHKNMPEFETLLEEYKFTDIDQELDTFYLDTIESFGGEIDLISN